MRSNNKTNRDLLPRVFARFLWRWLHVFPSASYWFIVLRASLLIGQTGLYSGNSEANLLRTDLLPRVKYIEFNHSCFCPFRESRRFYFHRADLYCHHKLNKTREFPLFDSFLPRGCRSGLQIIANLSRIIQIA